MATALDRFRSVYGSNPLHLLTLIAGFALFGYVLATIKPATLWNTHTWWQSIVVWFAAAIIAHDLVLFPLYAAVDRILVASSHIRPRAERPVPDRGRLVGDVGFVEGGRRGKRLRPEDVPVARRR